MPKGTYIAVLAAVYLLTPAAAWTKERSSSDPYTIMDAYLSAIKAKLDWATKYAGSVVPGAQQQLCKDLDAFTSSPKASGYLLEVGKAHGQEGLQRRLIKASGDLKQDVLQRLTWMANDLKLEFSQLGAVGDALDTLESACTKGNYEEPEDCEGLDEDVFSALHAAAHSADALFSKALAGSSKARGIVRASGADFSGILGTRDAVLALPKALGSRIDDAWRADRKERCPEMYAAAVDWAEARASKQKEYDDSRAEYRV
jgi:hypothetical protein